MSALSVRRWRLQLAPLLVSLLLVLLWLPCAAQAAQVVSPAVAPTLADQTAPDQTAPDQTAPDQTAPDQMAPDQTVPELKLAEPASAEFETARGPALEEAVLAGGCFWCLEHDLEHLPGVVDAVSGYSGGGLRNPTYQQVSAGGTGHQEAVRVRFDPTRLSYGALLRSYWRNIDPLDGGGQFCDRGSSYRPVIFTSGAGQQRQATASLQEAARELDRPAAALRVQIKPLQVFWPAEGYHQDYAEINSVKYRYYRWACGRDRRLDALWGSRARSGRPWAKAD